MNDETLPAEIEAKTIDTTPPPLDEGVLAMTDGELIHELVAIRDERRELSQHEKELVEDWREYEGVLMARLDHNNVKRVSNDEATATVTETDVPMVIDWDAFLTYCRENDAMHLLQRRVATQAWRELKDAGVIIPGVEVFVKREISLRKKQ